MHALKRAVESRPFRWLGTLSIVTMFVIAIVHQLGGLSDDVFYAILTSSLLLYGLLLALRLLAYGRAFFRDPWNNFDLAVMGAAVFGHPILVLALTFRIVRSARLLHRFPILRLLSDAFIASLVIVVALTPILLLMVSVAAIIATETVGTNLEYFSSVERSALSFFQLATLDAWASEIGRTVFEEQPLLLLLIIPFILFVGIALMNVAIAMIGATLQELQKQRNSHWAFEAELSERLISEIQDEVDRRITEMQPIESSQSGPPEDPLPVSYSLGGLPLILLALVLFVLSLIFLFTDLDNSLRDLFT